MASFELQALLKKKPSLMTILKLKRTEAEESTLVCDLNSVVAWLSGIIANCCNLDILSSKMTAFVRALRHIGVEPVFFCNTPVSFSNKDEFKLLLPQIRSEYLDSLDVTKKNCLYQKYALFCTNPLIVVQMQLLLESLNVKAVYVLGNFMAEVALYVAKHNTIGLLSFNAEFAIFPHVLFIHIDFFDLEKDIDIFSRQPIVTPNEIICACVNSEMLSSEIGLTGAGLIDLAIILGNCFSMHLNDKYCIGKYLRIYDKGLESMVTFLKGFQSPVFESCSKLSYFCDLHDEYRYVVSQSLSLYNEPHLFTVTENDESIISNWVKEKMFSGLLPSYFYAIVIFGTYMRHPFYEDHSICNTKIYENVLFLRKILYFLLGVEIVHEFGYDKNKPFAKTKVELEITNTPVESVSRLNDIWRLSLASKCELLASISIHSDRLSDNSFKTYYVQKQSVKLDYWIVATSLFLFCRNGGYDGHMFDAIYMSVLMFLSGIDLFVFDHVSGNLPRDLNAVNAFSYILQLLYDISMLLGLGKDLSLPSIVYSPSFSLKVLLLNASSLVCDSCEKFFTSLMKKILSFSPVYLFRLKCVDYTQNMQNQHELISLFESALLELKNQKAILKKLFSELACRGSNNVPSEVLSDDASLSQKNEIGNSSISCSTDDSSDSSNNASTCSSVETEFSPDCVCAHNSKCNSLQTDIISEEKSSITNKLSDAKDGKLELISMQKTQPEAYEASPLVDEVLTIAASNIPSYKNQDGILRGESLQQNLNKCVEDSPKQKKQLSVLQHKAEIIQLILDYRAVCIEGEAGCGKSTMIPQFILDSSHSKYCKIIICQPRRISAINLARHVAEQRNQRCGSVVGFCVGGEKKVSSNTSIVYCTTGYLLQMLIHNPQFVKQYTHVILDEVHDRTATYDFVTLLFRKLSTEILDSKLIIMSATMQGPLFVRYFKETMGDECVSKPFYVGNRCYPVEEYFIDEINEKSVINSYDYFLDTQKVSIYNLLSLSKKDMIHNVFIKLVIMEPKMLLFTEEVCSELVISQAVRGMSILVFLPGLAEILDYFDFLYMELKGRKIEQHFSIFVLHSQVPLEEQEGLLNPPPADKVHVILSTNIAESSITIPMLHVVINFGLQKASKYDYKRRMTCLIRCWCSRAACAQRSGRVGRLCPGKVFHLFPKSYYREVMPDHDIPELLSSSLAKSLLQARFIGENCNIDAPSDVLKLAIEPPSFTEINAAVRELVIVGALVPLTDGEASETGKITLLGEFSMHLPLDIDLCRLILYGLCFGCSSEAIIMAAGLSLKCDCFTMPSRVLIKDQKQFVNSLSKSVETRLLLDNLNMSDPLMFVQVFWEWIKFSDMHRKEESHLNKFKLINLFSKIHSVQSQRFLQFLSSFTILATKVKALLPPTSLVHQNLALLIEALQMNNYHTKQPLLSDILFCNNLDQLRSLLVATFVQNSLYGIKKTESFDQMEQTLAQRSYLRILESKFDLTRSIVLRQMSNGNESAFIELVKTIVPDSPVRINTVCNVAVIEFQKTPTFIKNISQFWQFCERHSHWSIENSSIVYDKPHHPMEISWFRWSPQMEKVDILNWRNRTALVCDFSIDSLPHIAVATTLERVTSRNQVKGKYLTILPQTKKQKLPILLLLAFQPYTSTVLFNVDHTSRTIQSIIIESQELNFGLWHKVTLQDLMILNKLREALSLLLVSSTCRHYLPVDKFHNIKNLLSNLIVPCSQRTEEMPSIYTGPNHCHRPYYPKYTCSILQNISTSSNLASLEQSSKTPADIQPFRNFAISTNNCFGALSTVESLSSNHYTCSTSRSVSQPEAYSSTHTVNPEMPDDVIQNPCLHVNKVVVNDINAVYPENVLDMEAVSTAVTNENKCISSKHHNINATSIDGTISLTADGKKSDSPSKSEFSVKRTVTTSTDGTIFLKADEKSDSPSKSELLVEKSGTKYEFSNESDLLISQYNSDTEATTSSSESQNSLSDIEDEQMTSHQKSSQRNFPEFSEICFTLPGSPDNVIMTSLENKLVSFIYCKGKSVSYSGIMSNNELRMFEYLHDESLTIQFFLKRPHWFKVHKYFVHDDREKIDYIIDLVNLVPKCE